MGFRDHAKSATKALSWRAFAAVDTFALTWLITGSIHAGLGVVGFEVVTKSFMYYAHERLWTLSILTRWFHS